MFTWQNVTVLDRDWEDEYNEYLDSQRNQDVDEPEPDEDDLSHLLREYGI